jgi:hypothetical protein
MPTVTTVRPPTGAVAESAAASFCIAFSSFSRHWYTFWRGADRRLQTLAASAAMITMTTTSPRQTPTTAMISGRLSTVNAWYQAGAPPIPSPVASDWCRRSVYAIVESTTTTRLTTAVRDGVPRSCAVTRR